MADRKAVNKYYPPDWTPNQGSINKYNGSHPLRERARKLHEGILIIRFEMPYNIWCGGCGNHIGMGVRYNAEKKKVGNYYTTPIYQFRMKCHLCDNHFEIKTDPQNFDYVVVSGARRQEGRWDPTQNEQVAPDDSEVKKHLATNAMYKLEHGVTDKGKSSSVAPTIAELESLQDRWKDDYTSNQLLRKRFRDKKKELKVFEEQDRALLNKSSLSISLVKEHPDDVYLASLLKLTPVQDIKDAQKKKREEIESRPLFGPSASFSKSDRSFGNIVSSKPSPLSELAEERIKKSPGITSGLTLPGVKIGVRKKQVNSGEDLKDKTTTGERKELDLNCKTVSNLGNISESEYNSKSYKETNSNLNKNVELSKADPNSDLEETSSTDITNTENVSKSENDSALLLLTNSYDSCSD